MALLNNLRPIEAMKIVEKELKLNDIEYDIKNANESKIIIFKSNKTNTKIKVIFQKWDIVPEERYKFIAERTNPRRMLNTPLKMSKFLKGHLEKVDDNVKDLLDKVIVK